MYKSLFRWLDDNVCLFPSYAWHTECQVRWVNRAIIVHRWLVIHIASSGTAFILFCIDCALSTKCLPPPRPWCVCSSFCHLAFVEFLLSTYSSSTLFPCNKFYMPLLSWMWVLSVVFGNFLILFQCLWSSNHFFLTWSSCSKTNKAWGWNIVCLSPGHWFLWTTVMSVPVSALGAEEGH